jgi:tRNA A-37 threonylcarbamoyl transferase component Bud32
MKIKITPSFYTQSKVEYNEGKKFVTKCYSSIFGIKWFLISGIFNNYPYASQPIERMGREIEFFTDKWSKVKVPRIIDMDMEKMCLFREFVEGREVTNDKKDFRLLGYVMKEIHEKGFVMGDTKPSNFMISEETVFVIDAEQSTRNSSSEYKAWDILVLTLFSSFLFINEVVDFREALREFLSSYELNREIALKLTGVKNAPLLALFPPPHLLELKKISAEYL